MGQGRAIDWSKAGTRLRRTPQTPEHGGRNPDWNFRSQRWMTADEYAGAEMTHVAIIERAACPTCHAEINETCEDARGNPMTPHAEREAAAGRARIDAGEFSL